MMTFTLYWLTGKRETVEGNTVEQAMTQAGYGGGSTRALDFWARGDNQDYIWNAETHNWDMTPEASKRIFGDKI